MTPVQDSRIDDVPTVSSERSKWKTDSAEASAIPARRRTVLSALAASEWAVGLAVLALDVVSWILLYGVISYLRRDIFLVGPFEFVLVDVIQLVVICQALYMIGGYDRNNDKQTLTYTAEHILAIAAAAAISSLIVYAAATFDSSMKPSRSAVLLSFLVFLPWSIMYRRILTGFWLSRRRVAHFSSSAVENWRPVFMRPIGIRRTDSGSSLSISRRKESESISPEAVRRSSKGIWRRSYRI